jgi:hypothetical protein
MGLSSHFCLKNPVDRADDRMTARLSRLMTRRLRALMTGCKALHLPVILSLKPRRRRSHSVIRPFDAVTND